MKLKVNDHVAYIAAGRVCIGVIILVYHSPKGVQYNILTHAGEYTAMGIHEDFIFPSEKEAYRRLLQGIDHAIFRYRKKPATSKE